jgi:nitrogen regulatory protein PII-like uncharacterized protein
MITTKTLTESQMQKLRAEAAVAGDFAMVAICDLGMTGGFYGDDYTALTPRETRRIAGMSRDDAYSAIVDALNSAQG